MSNDEFCMSNRLNFGLRASAVAPFHRRATTGGASSRIRSCHPRAVLFSPKASGIFQPSGKRRRSAALGRPGGEQNQRREQPDEMMEHLRDGMMGPPPASQKNRRAILIHVPALDIPPASIHNARMAAPATFDSFSAELSRLTGIFEKNLSHYKKAGYDEASLRQEFLNPLFSALGWDVENKAGHIPQKREVEVESRTQIGGRAKRADYLFRTDGRDRFVCEAKGDYTAMFGRG